jgi:hypothetical protein
MSHLLLINISNEGQNGQVMQHMKCTQNCSWKPRKESTWIPRNRQTSRKVDVKVFNREDRMQGKAFVNRY